MQHKHKLVIAAGEVEGNGGKISSITIAVTGDRVWELREVNISGDVKYKLSNALNLPHIDLHIPFKTALYAKIVSGATGEINIQLE